MITLAKPTVGFSRFPAPPTVAAPVPATEKQIQWTHRLGAKTQWHALADLAKLQHFFDIDWSVGWRTRAINGPWVELTR
jgi:hypothetical protein